MELSRTDWPDLIVLGIIIWSAYTATRRGFVVVLLSLLGFAISLIAAFAFFGPLSEFLSKQFGWSLMWTKPLAFVGIWIVVELVFGISERAILRRFGYSLQESSSNRLFAVIPGAIQGVIISAVLLTMLAL